MAVELLQLTQYLNQYLNVEQIKDYCPNGLQVEGKASINHILTGVTACQALIDAAIDAKADAILVHHGYFWRNETACLVGIKRNRIKALFEHEISLMAYHLPLDVHPVLGNNVQLAMQLGVVIEPSWMPADPSFSGVIGKLPKPMLATEFAQLVKQRLGREPSLVDSGNLISKVGLCTGGGQGFIDQAIAAGVDLYLTGEASEQTYHSAVENGVSFIAAGHHATERYGIKALGEHIQQTFAIEQQFIDINNPF